MRTREGDIGQSGGTTVGHMAVGHLAVGVAQVATHHQAIRGVGVSRQLPAHAVVLERGIPANRQPPFGIRKLVDEIAQDEDIEICGNAQRGGGTGAGCGRNRSWLGTGRRNQADEQANQHQQTDAADETQMRRHTRPPEYHESDDKSKNGSDSDEGVVPHPA